MKPKPSGGAVRTCPLVGAPVVALGALGALGLAEHGQLGGDLLLHAALLVGLVGGADQLQGHHHHRLGAHAVPPRGHQRGHLPPAAAAAVVVGMVDVVVDVVGGVDVGIGADPPLGHAERLGRPQELREEGGVGERMEGWGRGGRGGGEEGGVGER